FMLRRVKEQVGAVYMCVHVYAVYCAYAPCFSLPQSDLIQLLFPSPSSSPQVLDQLPEKVEKVLRCALSGYQKRLYYALTMKTTAESGEGGGMGGLNNTIMQLRKVCNHPYLFIKDYVVDEDLVRASGKFELLDRMLPKLRAAGHRVLIFSQMVEVINFLEDFCLFRQYSCLRLDGQTSSEEREKRMYMFNDPTSPYFVFLLSTRAGGLGLNLASADTVIIFDRCVGITYIIYVVVLLVEGGVWKEGIFRSWILCVSRWFLH
ncbi:hypothetical protein EON64_21290, partial [archaeon]